MSLNQLKTEASALTDVERRELISYLVSLGRDREAGYWDKLAGKLEDRDPSHWVREEQLDKVLGLDRPEE